tara:strand:+ start:1054 stop:1707 length:654 start_codon:yes stop_codon:yes gene_type:complete
MPGVLKLEGTNIATGDGNGAITINNATLGSAVTVPASVGGTRVLLEKYTADNSTTAKVFDLSTYSESFEEYLFVINKLIPASDNRELHVRLGSATNNIDSTSGNYRTSGLIQYFVSTSSTGTNPVYLLNEMHRVYNIGGSTGEGLSGEIKMFGLRDSSVFTQSTFLVTNYYYGDSQETLLQGGIHQVAQDDKAVSFAIGGNGNWGSGTITVYGVRNA